MIERCEQSLFSSEVEALWRRIKEMEDEGRFDGRAYPDGLAPFPGRLKGQGFFPGGDGLWRNETQLREASSFPIPRGGIMFIGNDFGTLKRFRATLKSQYENPQTWRRLKSRLERAGISGETAFFTNSVLGLRTTGTALDAKDWTVNAGFAGFCREFLEFQIDTIRPNLLVLLGPQARDSVCARGLDPLFPALAKWQNANIGLMNCEESILGGKWRDRPIVAHVTSHPYSDIGKYKTDARKAEDAFRLSCAWQAARGIV